MSTPSLAEKSCRRSKNCFTFQNKYFLGQYFGCHLLPPSRHLDFGGDCFSSYLFAKYIEKLWIGFMKLSENVANRQGTDDLILVNFESSFIIMR